jgi:hypothetical protein
MGVAELPDRPWLHATALHLGIRLRYAAESWAGLKPFLTDSLSGYPETASPPGPRIDAGTALGVKLLWALAGFFRQHPLGSAVYRFSGLRWGATRAHAALYRRILATCHEAEPARRDMPLPEFDWRTRSPEDFRREHIERPHPAVLRGFGADCEAVRSWSFRSLLDRFGEEKVLLTTRELDGDPGKLAAVEDGKVYLHNSEILFRRHPELVDALPLDRLCAYSDLRPTYLQLFLGRKGTGSPFHAASNWNWFFNIEGRKTWWFVDPRHGMLIYPFAAMGQAAAFALCGYPSEYDREYFPAFAYCPIFEVTLEPGDVVFNPPWWWHAVRNVTDTTVGVASRWIRQGRVGTQLRMIEEDYDIDRMRSWLFFAGLPGWLFLQRVLRSTSPSLTPDITLREQKNRFAHLQHKLASEPVFGMRHRY